LQTYKNDLEVRHQYSEHDTNNNTFMIYLMHRPLGKKKPSTGKNYLSPAVLTYLSSNKRQTSIASWKALCRPKQLAHLIYAFPLSSRPSYKQPTDGQFFYVSNLCKVAR